MGLDIMAHVATTGDVWQITIVIRELRQALGDQAK